MRRLGQRTERDVKGIRDRLLKHVLQGRLEEVSARIPNAASVEDRRQSDHGTPDVDPEETLRIVMVRLWPRVSDDTAGVDERESLKMHLRTLWQIAHGEDLRFLDAWNNAYEALRERAEEDFLRDYASLLVHHVERLASR